MDPYNDNNNFNLDQVQLNSVSNLPSNSFEYMNNLAINPVIIIVLVIVIIIYFAIFSSINKNDGEQKTGNGFLEALLWGIFIILILLNGASYFLNTNIFATIKNFFSNEPELNISLLDSNIGSVNPNAPESEQVLENPLTEEVYHIPGNKYTYNDAKAMCKAFEGELANYEQIENAYDKGANWCSYGWSADQLALFPTNMKVWKKLQKNDATKNACGRPGINGGYIANPNVRFGINCYGHKPLITNQEQHLMKNSDIVPKTQKDIQFDNLVNHYKNQLRDILVAPFNKKNWNEGLL
jgi:hypothetical protein